MTSAPASGPAPASGASLAAARARPSLRSVAARLAPSAISLVMAALCAVAAFLLVRGGVAVSATAAPWFDGLTGTGKAPASVGAVLRAIAFATSATPTHAAILAQAGIATGILFTVARLGLHLRGAWAAVAAVVALLVWPAGREATLVLSAESVLALSGTCLAWGGIRLEDQPRRGLVLIGFGLALAILAHPLGLGAAPALALAALLWPRPPPPEGLERLRTETGLAVRSVWLAWLGGVVLGLALVIAILPEAGLKSVWTQAIAAMRAAAPTPDLGWLASRPVLGPVVALAGQVPVLLLGLALSGSRAALRVGQVAEALPAALIAAWLLVFAVAGLPPVPAGIDGLAVVAPLVVVVAIVAGADLASALLGRTGRWARVGAAVLVLAAIASLFADTWLGLDDRRNALAHVPGVLQATAPLRPVVLEPGDVGLLHRQQESTAVLPARPGGTEIARAIKVLHPALERVDYVLANAAALVLLPARSTHPIDVALRAAADRVQCSATGRTCLHRLRGRPEPSGRNPR